MPLPKNRAVWPPAKMKLAHELMDVHDAWYSGDVMSLQRVYQGTQWQSRRSQHEGGIVGFMARLFWGKPHKQGENRPQLHLPLPATISAMSADLLFSEPPRFVIPDASKTSLDGTIVTNPSQDALEKLVNVPMVHTVLLDGAELASAFGGVYYRLVWSKDHLEQVMIESVSADFAAPTFRFGKLESVLFWRELREEDEDRDKGKVFWHLELHEVGKITHGLYEGSSDNLGKRIPLGDHPATEWIAKLKASGEEGGTQGVSGGTDEKVLATGINRLTATYMPNILPNREFRRDPYLSRFGRSDYAGIEPAFDAIDEAWTSWSRDVRLAKARIIVPESFLDTNGRGSGYDFDQDREVFVGMNFLNSGGDASASSIHAQQFNIRVAEHEQTISAWTRYALRSSGYSTGSIGDGSDGTVRTATEVNSADRLTERTRDKKINYAKEALSDLILAWTDMNAMLYATPKLEEKPEIRFPSESQQDPEELARIASMQASSQSSSVMTRVRSMHPEWDGATVNEEVQRIYQEIGIGTAPMPDAAAYRGILDNAVTDAMRNPMGDEEAAEMAAQLAQRAQAAKDQTKE